MLKKCALCEKKVEVDDLREHPDDSAEDEPRKICWDCYVETRPSRSITRRYGHGDPWLIECASEKLWFPGCSWDDYEQMDRGETLILTAHDGAQGQLYDMGNIYFAEIDGVYLEAEQLVLG